MSKTKSPEDANPVEPVESPVVETPETEQPKAPVEEPAKEEPIKEAEPVVEPVTDQPKDDELDIQDGRRLDQNVKAAEFDADAEEKAAHAKKPHTPDNVKHAVVNPNGAGNEWPR